MSEKRKMKKPTKRQLYDMLAEYKKITDIYEKLLEEFKIEKVEEKVKLSMYQFDCMIINRLYVQGENRKHVAISVDKEHLKLYGVDKDGK